MKQWQLTRSCFHIKYTCYGKKKFEIYSLDISDQNLKQRTLDVEFNMKVYVEFRKKINEKYGRRVREYMNSSRNKKDLKKREKIQLHFWNQVGCDEHISLPMLENEIIKEFNCKDDRFVRVQVNLMQFETRIRIESRVKVWIKEPINSH